MVGNTLQRARLWCLERQFSKAFSGVLLSTRTRIHTGLDGHWSSQEIYSHTPDSRLKVFGFLDLYSKHSRWL